MLKHTLISLAMLAAFPAAHAAATSAARLGNDLALTVAVDSNKGGSAGAPCADLGADWALCLKGRLILDNRGYQPVDGKDWTLYLHSIRRLLRVEGNAFTLRHITGDLYELKPGTGFRGIPSGGRLELPLVAEYWMLQYSDVLPRPYVVAGGQSAVLRYNDNDDASYMWPLKGDDWKHPGGEERPLSTASERYRQFGARGPAVEAAQVAGRALPTVLRQQTGSGQLAVQGLSLELAGVPDASVDALRQRAAQIGLRGNGVRVQGRVVGAALPADIATAGGYRLRVGEGGVQVEGFDAAGVFYGVQTLLSLVPAGGGRVPQLVAEDAPRYPHRGFMLDVARNFRQPATIRRLVDQMAAYKLNKLHLHLSDDEGWRVEIPGLPELTDVGGKRCHDLSETRCLLPQLASGPDNRSGGGYLSRRDYVDLLRYARARNVEVIPEIDMPAHARAAVVSMEARYRRLAAQGQVEEANRYRLLDPADTSNTLSVQFYDRRSYLNPCVPGAKRFADKVIAEVAAMHREAGMPLSTWHFGGDEAKNILLGGGFQDKTGTDPGKGKIDLASQDKPWARSPQCQAQVRAGRVHTVDELPLNFAREVSRSVAANGIATMGAWQDGLKGAGGPQDFATQNTLVTVWDTLFWGGAAEAHHWAGKGYKTVLSLPDYLYFDFPYELNPKERGYYWASRATDSYKVFSLAPDNLPQNAEVMPDRQGRAFEITSEAQPARFAGIQGQAWGEIMRTDAQFEAMAYPRLLALAERAWHRAGWERPYRVGERYKLGETNLVDKAALNRDWQGFAAVLGWRELAKLERAGVQYRLPLPAVGSAGSRTDATAEVPGVALQYSYDRITWWPYAKGSSFGSPQYWRSVSPSGARASRVESVSE